MHAQLNYTSHGCVCRRGRRKVHPNLLKFQRHLGTSFLCNISIQLMMFRQTAYSTLIRHMSFLNDKARPHATQEHWHLYPSSRQLANWIAGATLLFCLSRYRRRCKRRRRHSVSNERRASVDSSIGRLSNEYFAADTWANCIRSRGCYESGRLGPRAWGKAKYIYELLGSRLLTLVIFAVVASTGAHGSILRGWSRCDDRPTLVFNPTSRPVLFADCAGWSAYGWASLHKLLHFYK